MFISSALSISDYKFALYDLLAFRFRIEAKEINLVNNSRSTNYLCFLCMKIDIPRIYFTILN